MAEKSGISDRQSEAKNRRERSVSASEARPRQRNKAAVAGLFLSWIFWPAGLVISIIALRKSRSPGGTGKELAVVGLVASVLFAFLTAGAIAVIARSAGTDPACTTATRSAATLDQDLTTGEANIGSGSSADSTASLGTFVARLRSDVSDLDSAQALAVQQPVQAAISGTELDLGTLLTSLQAAKDGDQGLSDQTLASIRQVGSDANSIDSACGT
jgi:hypothetical protein